MKDIYFSAFLAALLASVIVLYLVRVLLRGRARHARTDADGGSILLGKSVMEMAYWLLDPVVARLAVLRITPDMVTVFSLTPGLGAGVAAAYGWFGLACALGTLCALCDIIDGLLARHAGAASGAGEVIDTAVDRYTESAFLAGLIVYYRADSTILFFAIAALIGSFMVSYTTAKAEALGVPPPRGSMRRAERAIYLLTAAGLSGFSKPLYGSELPIQAAIAFVAVVSNISAVRRFATIARLLR